MTSSSTHSKFIVIIIVVTYAICAQCNKHDVKRSKKNHKNEQQQKIPKYILLWNSAHYHNFPYNSYGEGSGHFKKANCTYRNCYVTVKRDLLHDDTKFDAIILVGTEVIKHNYKLPQRRKPNQLYVFYMLESADRCPVCKKNMDNFFNTTMTYRLNSDFLANYFNISDIKGNIIAPKVDITWIPKEDMLPVSAEFGNKLGRKYSAAAWFVSNCNTKLLKNELARFNFSIDVYGKCGTMKCPKYSKECGRYLQVKYFFYLAFENSFSEDYITEKAVTGLLHDAVPIVYGGANYTRYLPDGSYIDGRRLGPANTARTMYEMMMNQARYRDMFRWKQHYKVVRVWPPSLCRLCEQLHKPQKPRVYKNLRKWWNPEYKKRC